MKRMIIFCGLYLFATSYANNNISTNQIDTKLSQTNTYHV